MGIIVLNLIYDFAKENGIIGIVIKIILRLFLLLFIA